MNESSDSEGLQKLLTIIDREDYFHASNAIGKLKNQGETDCITDTLKIGIRDLLERILSHNNDTAFLNAFSHYGTDMQLMFEQAKPYMSEHAPDLVTLKQEFLKLTALCFETWGDFRKATTYYQKAEMHEKVFEMGTKVQLSNEERHKIYPTAEGIENWKKALHAFSQHPAVIGFITRQERDELLKKIRTRVTDLLAAKS